jgi:hypothetical protein
MRAAPDAPPTGDGTAISLSLADKPKHPSTAALAGDRTSSYLF